MWLRTFQRTGVNSRLNICKFKINFLNDGKNFVWECCYGLEAATIDLHNWLTLWLWYYPLCDDEVGTGTTFFPRLTFQSSQVSSLSDVLVFLCYQSEPGWNIHFNVVASFEIRWESTTVGYNGIWLPSKYLDTSLSSSSHFLRSLSS